MSQNQISTIYILPNVHKYFIRSLTREFFKSFRTKKRIPPPDPPYSLYQVGNRQIDTLHPNVDPFKGCNVYKYIFNDKIFFADILVTKYFCVRWERVRRA